MSGILADTACSMTITVTTLRFSELNRCPAVSCCCRSRRPACTLSTVPSLNAPSEQRPVGRRGGWGRGSGLPHASAAAPPGWKHTQARRPERATASPPPWGFLASEGPGHDSQGLTHQVGWAEPHEAPGRSKPAVSPGVYSRHHCRAPRSQGNNPRSPGPPSPTLPAPPGALCGFTGSVSAQMDGKGISENPR